MGTWWVLFFLQPLLRLVCHGWLLWLGLVQSVVQGVCWWGSVKRRRVEEVGGLVKQMHPAPLTIFCLPCSDSSMTELYHISRLWIHRLGQAWRDNCVDNVIGSFSNSFNVASWWHEQLNVYSKLHGVEIKDFSQGYFELLTWKIKYRTAMSSVAAVIQKLCNHPNLKNWTLSYISGSLVMEM